MHQVPPDHVRGVPIDMTGGVAIILGRTGKNFGAGMSGGLAFVYDPEHRLPSMCNADVAGDLSALAPGEVRALDCAGFPAVLQAAPRMEKVAV